MFRNKISRSQTCLYSIFYQKRYRIYTTISRYRGHSAIVWHSTNFATVHSRVTEGGCLMEYKYKLLCQFSTDVGGTRFMTQTEPQQFTAGPHEVFLLICRNRIERQWLKSSWILEQWQTEKFKNMEWNSRAYLHNNQNWQYQQASELLSCLLLWPAV